MLILDVRMPDRNRTSLELRTGFAKHSVLLIVDNPCSLEAEAKER